MPSLVLELQQEALRSNIQVADLLRKALTVATKLNVHEFQEWSKMELYGYKQNQLPEYRKVTGEVSTQNPYRGWIPVIFDNPETTRILSQRYVGQSVGELENMIANSKEGRKLTIPYDPELLKHLVINEWDSVPTLIIGDVQIFGILESVRNIILEWTLKLEQDGILGEGLTFTQEEKQKASSTTYNIDRMMRRIKNPTIKIVDTVALLEQRRLRLSKRSSVFLSSGIFIAMS